MPSRARPDVVLGLIAVSALVLLYQLSLSAPARVGFTLANGFVPAYASARTIASGLLIQPDLLAGVVNLLALWIFGDNVEDRLGHGRFLLLYILGGVAAALAALGLDAAARTALPLAAAAVTAVMGAHVALFPRAQVLVAVPYWLSIELVEVPSLLIVAGWLLVHGMRYAGSWLLTSSLTGALVMPLVGFGVGAVAALVLRRRDRMRAEWWSGRAGS